LPLPFLHTNILN